MELEELYDKVVDIINNHDDYHCGWICISNSVKWYNDCVEFDVKVYSDQRYGSEWTEYWRVYSDGRINRDGEWYNSFEEFEADFC